MIIESGKNKIMSRKQKSFSMAEMLIALLAVSIIVSATIPTFTRKASTNEQVFRFIGSGGGNGGYACPGDSCSIVIGHNRVPDFGTSPTQYYNTVYGNNISITPSNNNLDLVKNYKGGRLVNHIDSKASGDSDNSHLIFYNKNTEADTDNVRTVGRMYFDETNLGVGINTLSFVNPGPPPNAETDYGRRNTAFGQLALFSFADSTTNKPTITNDFRNYKDSDKYNGTDNTGVGYNALTASTNTTFVDLSPSKNYNNDSFRTPFGIQQSSGNTGVGSFALTLNNIGSYNTAIGRGAMHAQTNSRTDINGRHSNLNTAVGFNAMRGNEVDRTDGTYDTIFNNTIINNILTGQSGYDIHSVFGTGSANVAVGAFALPVSRYATANIAIGPMALYRYTGGTSSCVTSAGDSSACNEFGNIAIGANALARLTQGNSNVVIGLDAARRLTSTNSSSNVIIGRDAFLGSADNSNTVEKNVIIGAKIPDNGYAVSSNVFLGYQSANGVSADTSNSIVIGANATNSSSTVSGSNNFILGTDGHRLFEGTIPTVDFKDITKSTSSSGNKLLVNAHRTSFDNIYIGTYDGTNYLANDSNTHGEAHIGNRLIVGSYGVTKGYASNVPIDIAVEYDTSNNPAPYVRIGSTNQYGAMIYANKSTEGDDAVISVGQIKTSSSDIGTTSNFYITGNGTLFAKNIAFPINNINTSLLDSNNKIKTSFLPNFSTRSFCTSVSGGVTSSAYCSGTDDGVTGWQTSDARLKNILSESTAGLKEINALEVKNFTFKKDEKKTPHVGVIAQSLQKIFPNAVTKDDEGYLMIRTEDIFYAMVNSIKELYRDFQDLTAKITGLDKRLSELEKQNQQLTEQNKAFEARLKKLEAKTAN